MEKVFLTRGDAWKADKEDDGAMPEAAPVAGVEPVDATREDSVPERGREDLTGPNGEAGRP